MKPDTIVPVTDLFDQNPNDNNINKNQFKHSRFNFPINQPQLKNTIIMNVWGICMATGSLISGYLFVIVSVLSTSMTDYVQQQGYLDVNMSLYISICTTSLSIGGLLGTLIYPKLLSIFKGENRLFAACNISLIVLILIQLFNLNIYQHTFTRFFQGFIVGIYGIIVPTYLMSIAPTKMSGQMGALNQIMVTIGIALGYCMGYIIDQNDLGNIYNWRICILAPIPMCLIGLFIGQVFPINLLERHIENRQWQILLNYIERFYRKGTFSIQDLIRSKNLKVQKYQPIPKSKKDLKNLQKVNTQNNNFPQQTIQDSKIEKTNDLIEQNQSSQGYKLRKMVSIVLCVVSQFCGINAIIFYANQLFFDISKGDQSYAVSKSVELGFFQIFITILSGAFMDQFGRKTLLLFGSSLIIIALMGSYYMLQFDKQSGWDPSLVAYAVFLHIGGFSLSYGPITVLYMSEILQDISSYMTLIWIETIIISLTSNLMIQNIGTGNTFFIYGIVTIIGIIYLRKNMIETKGFTRQQIVANFNKFSLKQSSYIEIEPQQ